MWSASREHLWNEGIGVKDLKASSSLFWEERFRQARAVDRLSANTYSESLGLGLLIRVPVWEAHDCSTMKTKVQRLMAMTRFTLKAQSNLAPKC